LFIFSLTAFSSAPGFQTKDYQNQANTFLMRSSLTNAKPTLLSQNSTTYSNPFICLYQKDLSATAVNLMPLNATAIPIMHTAPKTTYQPHDSQIKTRICRLYFKLWT
jgi:hypothetical protein